MIRTGVKLISGSSQTAAGWYTVSFTADMDWIVLSRGHK